ncbi:hypothetical protein IV203_026459 [Nitzschia inconspicua]|uniref:Uncharacterized protein n=1 Tax=Nitzschia inconspicua TaxID=303405 RepID=A0A9K3LJQ6_9STRA|nr:hypothetical protein IV203_026459 [Nitzschia inconspicua]
MGNCCSAAADELPAATATDIERIRSKGYLPVVAGPSVDFHGTNQLQTVYIAEYENGAELTLLFLDEDRPNACEDCLYDTIRRPLFGRYTDVESVIIIGKEMVFPGTYAADQTWKEKMPKHNTATVPMEKFEKHGDGAEFILWVNTWNHLVGEQNNNPAMEITHQHAQAAGGKEHIKNKDFVVRKGSRAEVDARFKGIMTSVSSVMTPEREKQLGKRLW